MSHRAVHEPGGERGYKSYVPGPHGACLKWACFVRGHRFQVHEIVHPLGWSTVRDRQPLQQDAAILAPRNQLLPVSARDNGA